MASVEWLSLLPMLVAEEASLEPPAELEDEDVEVTKRSLSLVVGTFRA